MKTYPQNAKTGDDWPTPPDFFALLREEFEFTMDVAASVDNHVCGVWFDRKVNGLSQAWSGTVWCNPPYGKGIEQWVEKAYWSAMSGATVIMLLPVRSDTNWWHEFVIGCSEIRYLRGRLGFAGTKPGRAPFPSVVLVFRPGCVVPVGAGITYDVRCGNYKRIDHGLEGSDVRAHQLAGQGHVRAGDGAADADEVPADVQPRVEERRRRHHDERDAAELSGDRVVPEALPARGGR